MIVNDIKKPISNAVQAALDTKASTAALEEVAVNRPTMEQVQQAIDQSGGGGSGSNKIIIHHARFTPNGSGIFEDDLNYDLPAGSPKVKKITVIPFNGLEFLNNNISVTYIEGTVDSENQYITDPYLRLSLTSESSMVELAAVVVLELDALYAGSAQISLITISGDELNLHERNTNNPHNVTKAQVGLGNVDNTSDESKPLSAAARTALADKVSTIRVIAIEDKIPEAATSDNQLADKAYVGAEVAGAITSEVTNRNTAITDAVANEATARQNADNAINAKIPTQASDTNQLADKDFVNSSINALAAYYITKNAAGDPFGTKAELNSAAAYYSGGQVRVPTRNDYTIVLADESKTSATGSSPSTRYHYNNGVWEFQYIINNTPLTAAQLAALNSGATSTNMSALLDHLAATNNPHGVTKAQVGLGNVDNTSDADKPVSTATQNALNQKANTSDLTAHIGDTNNPHNVTKEQLGLGTTDNSTSAKFNFFPKDAYNANSCYIHGLYQIAKGSNCPSGSQYGVLLQLPYKEVTNAPQYSGQIFLPNGDDNKYTDTMFFRTANDTTWRDWQKVVSTNGDGLTIIETYLGAYDAPEIPENGLYIGDPLRHQSGSIVFGNFLKITQNSIDTLENTGSSIINPYTLGTFEGILSGTLFINKKGGVSLSDAFYTTPEGRIVAFLPAPMDYGYSNNSWINSEDVRGFIIGDPNATNQTETGYYMIFDANDIQCKRNTGNGYEAASMYINDYGGAVYLGKKTAIIDNGLAVIQLPGKMEYIPSTGETSTSDEWCARADACGFVIGDPYRKIKDSSGNTTNDTGKYIAIDGNDIQAKRNKGNNQYEVVDLYVQDYGAYLCVPKFKCRKNAESSSDYANNDDWNNTITVANGDGYTSEIKRSALMGRAYDERISWFPSGSTAYSRSTTGTTTLNSKLTPNYLAHNFSKLVITGYANDHVYSSVYDIQEVTKAYSEANAQLLEIRAGDKGTNRRVSCKYYYDGSKPYFKVDTLENWTSVSIRFLN